MKLGFGLIAFAAASKQYIIGGYEPSPNSEKYIVSLQRGGSHFCGGTVISSSKSLSFLGSRLKVKIIVIFYLIPNCT